MTVILEKDVEYIIVDDGDAPTATVYLDDTPIGTVDVSGRPVGWASRDVFCRESGASPKSTVRHSL